MLYVFILKTTLYGEFQAQTEQDYPEKSTNIAERQSSLLGKIGSIIYLGGMKLLYPSVNEYLKKMREGLSPADIREDMPVVYSYWLEQEAELKKILKNRETTFWTDIQRVLLIDAKLVLLRSYINDYDFHGFSEEEIIANVEQDHFTFNKELCGYSLKDQVHPSIIFGNQ